MPPVQPLTYQEYVREQELLRQTIEETKVKATVTKTRKKTNHMFHLVLTLLTGGLWGLVWLWLVIWHRFGTKDKAKTTYRY